MRNEDPWKNLNPSPREFSLIGHLVLECRPYEVFRARDSLGRRVLFLIHDPAHATSAHLPNMAGLEVEARTKEGDGRAMLVVRLHRDEDADVFARFCDDIISTVAGAQTEKEAVQAFIGRTWKWHALLRGARKKTLTREEQIGLIGELYTLSRIIGPERGIGAALEAWRGSEGAPKDFELPDLCIECKTRGASSRGKIRITSEHQLADVSGQEVVLIVHTFASATAGDLGAQDLHGVIRSLELSLSSDRPDLGDMLANKLREAGYDPEHEYEVVAAHQSTRAFKVTAQFPRIVPGIYPQGPIEIAYDLPLASIASFEIDIGALTELIRTSKDRHG